MSSDGMMVCIAGFIAVLVLGIAAHRLFVEHAARRQL